MKVSKEARQEMAWTGNDIFRRDNKRKATEKELKIVAKIMQKAISSLSNKASLLKEKELWLNELRYRKAELNEVRARDVKYGTIGCLRKIQEDATGASVV